MIQGCLFDTRDDHPPISDESDAVILDDPLAPFEALTVALESRKEANYERAISENFVFSPTQEDSSDQTFAGEPVYDNWTKAVELDVLRLLLADAQHIEVNFFPTAEGGGTTTFQRYRVAYELRVVTHAEPTDTSVYKGSAYFDNRNEGGNWRLVFWDELDSVPGFFTWGYLKGILRLRLNP